MIKRHWKPEAPSPLVPEPSESSGAWALGHLSGEREQLSRIPLDSRMLYRLRTAGGITISEAARHIEASPHQ